MAEADLHQQVCSPRFERIEKRLDDMADEVTDLKVNFSSLPETIKAIKDDVSNIRVMEEKRRRSRGDILIKVLLMVLGSGGVLSMVLSYLNG